MSHLFAEVVEVTTVQHLPYGPMVVALMFGLAGGFFIALVVLRRIKK